MRNKKHHPKQNLKSPAQSWDKLSKSNKYKRATIVAGRRKTTSQITTEVLDGILLNLNERNKDRSYASQKRILRKIVEKRQAQMVHLLIGRTSNLFSPAIERECIRRSMRDIKHSMAA